MNPRPTAPQVWDISPPLAAGIAVWPGDSPLRREVIGDLDRGDSTTLSTLHATVHLGAHADAPGHTTSGAGDIASQPLDAYLGRAQVVTADVRPGQRVTPDVLAVDITETRVLIRTNSFTDPQNWNTDFAALSIELIHYLSTTAQLALIGIDTPSIDLSESKDLPAHAACVARDVRILEGLVLSDVDDGIYELIALPLRLVGFDASPVRAVLRQISNDSPAVTPGR